MVTFVAGADACDSTSPLLMKPTPVFKLLRMVVFCVLVDGPPFTPTPPSAGTDTGEEGVVANGCNCVTFSKRPVEP